MAEPEVPAEAERLNPVEFQELVERAEEGPVVMLNLLDFKPAGGAERYAEYADAVEPLLERAGAQILFVGQGNAALIGPTKWDLVALVKYPTRRAFLDMIGSAEYQAIAPLRTEALERSELHPLEPAEV
jgi:uncharacterized protein (DUF1330 family)